MQVEKDVTWFILALSNHYNQHFFIACKLFDTQTSLQLFGFFKKKFSMLAALTAVSNITSTTIPCAA